jgi:hypothetical protein
MDKGLLDTAADVDLQPQLQQIVDMVEGKVKNMDAFDRIVTAGKKTMFNPKIRKQLTDGLATAENIPLEVGQGVAGIIMTLRQQSRGTMPVEPMMQAATVILMEALDSLSKVGILELTPDTIGEATLAMAEALLGAIGVSKEKMATLMGNVKTVVEDPAKLESYRAHSNKGAAPAPEQGTPPAPAPAQGAQNGI